MDDDDLKAPGALMEQKAAMGGRKSSINRWLTPKSYKRAGRETCLPGASCMIGTLHWSIASLQPSAFPSTSGRMQRKTSSLPSTVAFAISAAKPNYPLGFIALRLDTPFGWAADDARESLCA